MGLLKRTPAEAEEQVDALLRVERYDEVLDLLEEWDRDGFEWWTVFHERLSQIPHSLVRPRTRVLLRAVLPTAWAGRPARAFETLALAEEGAAGAGEGLQAQLRLTRGELCVETYRFEEAQQAFEGLEPLLEDPRLRLRLLNALAIICKETRFDLAEMEALWLRHNRIAMEIADHRAMSVSDHNLCMNVFIPLGRFQEAYACVERLLSPEVDSPFSRMMGLVCQALVRYYLGEDGLEESLRSAIAAADALGITVKVQQMSVMLAELLSRTGRLEEAESLVALCRERRAEGLVSEELLFCAAARLALLSGDEAAASRAMYAALRAALTPENKARALVEIAVMLAEAGRAQEAAGAAASALQESLRHGLKYMQARSLLLLFATSEDDRLANLRDCLALVRENGYESLLLHRQPEAALEALTTAASVGVESAYARSLLAWLDQPAVEVRILGPLRVRVGFRSVAEGDWGRAKARALFLYLLFRHRRVVPVDVLLDALFRDQPEGAAKNGLRVAATLLRDALEPERAVRGRSKYLTSDGKTMRLDLGRAAWVDWDEFRRQALRTRRTDLPVTDRIESAQLALSLVTEPILPEFYGEEWFFAELEPIEHEVRAVRVQLGLDLIEAREYVAAAEQGRRLRAADPLDEAALEIEVRAYCEQGAQPEALRRVRGFEKRWRAEYGEDSVSRTAVRCRELASET